ncbi:MAG TPA: Gfo/Idh/MocA family oxidoreductase [Pricia sp.]|nr:Gfo/Idh/MocA family oxidoreductase [Pricia sp.]
MSKINIGIIGTGSIVATYKKCIDALEDTQLIALYTKSPNRINEAEREFGVPVFSDMDAFLQNEMDLVCVCNESGRHGEAIRSVARAGKHVLSEKPLETTPEKIDGIIAICRAQNVKLGCTLQNRCSADYQRVAEAVRSGKLGKLLMGNAHIDWYRPESYYAESDWKGSKEFDGGAAFINQGIHTIDLLLHLMGPVRSVFGKVDTLVHGIEGEDVGVALLNFENAAMGSITAGTALYPGYPERIEIYGEHGSILMEGGKIKAWNIKATPASKTKANETGESDATAPNTTSDGEPVNDATVPNTTFDGEPVNGTFARNTTADENAGSGAADPTAIGHQNHKVVIADMIEAIRKDRPPMVDGPEARKAVAVIAAIYESSKRGELIFL